jgi:hypothetical protein
VVFCYIIANKLRLTHCLASAVESHSLGDYQWEVYLGVLLGLMNMEDKRGKKDV